MIRELFRVDAALSESVHLPGLAEEAPSAPVLGAFTLVMSHALSPKLIGFAPTPIYSRVSPRSSDH